jgi:hypothetical protein
MFQQGRKWVLGPLRTMQADAIVALVLPRPGHGLPFQNNRQLKERIVRLAPQPRIIAIAGAGGAQQKCNDPLVKPIPCRGLLATSELA